MQYTHRFKHFGDISACCNANIKYIVLDFTKAQTVWLVAAADREPGRLCSNLKKPCSDCL